MFKVIGFAWTLVMCYFIAGYVYVWLTYILNVFSYATTWIPLSICIYISWKVYKFFRRSHV